MDFDRQSRTLPAGRGQDSASETRVPPSRVEGMRLGSGSDRGSSGAVPRTAVHRSSAVGAISSDPDIYPPELRALLESTPSGFDEAWEAFVARHSRLLLHVARKVMPTSESAMDAYATVLERLRRDNCRSLAGYVPDGRSRFTTWLVVVARRMCVDFYRQKYGRQRGETTPEAAAEREARHRLVNFAGVDDALAHIADDCSPDPEDAIRHDQLQRALDVAFSSLTPDDQLLLRLRFHDDLSAQRIASVLAFPSPFHVYRRLRSVCAELRRKLLAAGVEDSTP